MASLEELRHDVPQTGRLVWIARARESRADLEVLDEVLLQVGTGVAGDHHCVRGAERALPPKRQVTIIQHEHLAVVAHLLGRNAVDPAALRRNLAVAGINLQSLKDQRFAIGAAVLQGSGDCHPCSRMSETLGAGGYAAMRGHGGITARVLVEGVIRLGDEVRWLPPEPAA